MKKNICWAALVLALCLPVCALAATEPNTRTIEDTTCLLYTSDAADE